MKKVILLFFIISLNFAFAKDDPEAAKAMRNIFSSLQSHKSISYDVVFRIKTLFANNYEISKGKVEIIRREDDKFFGIYFWYSINDTLEKYYDGTDVFGYFPKKKSVIYYDIKKEGLEGFYQETDGEVMRIPFIQPKSLLGLIGSNNNLKIATYKQNKNYKIITVAYPDEQKVKNMKMEIVFNPKDFTLVKIVSSGEFKNSKQVNEWNLSNVKFDQVTEESLRRHFLNFSNLKRTKYEKPKPIFNN